MIVLEGKKHDDLVLERRDYQDDMTKQGTYILLKHGLVYIAAQERVGKSYPALWIAANNLSIKPLILTKKAAMPDWIKLMEVFLAVTGRRVEYEILTYQSAHKITRKPDLVILDESHAYVSAFPVRSQTWKKVSKIAAGLPIIYISATSNAQGTHLLYNQLAISNNSPWKKYTSPYKWYSEYADRAKSGEYKTKMIQGTLRTDYTKVQHKRVAKEAEYLFVRKTRAEAGFEQEPEDNLHFIELSESIKKAYNYLMKHRVLVFKNGNSIHKLVCDSKIKLRCALHMLEGGTLKIKKEYIGLANSEKIDYIKKTWGDSSSLVIMYHYIAELEKLSAAFKQASLLQASTYAEGVDLSMYDNLVVYSQDFSTAKHSQRRARQANKNRKKPIDVHFLLVKDAISHQVYTTVSKNKTNFIDSQFKRKEL